MEKFSDANFIIFAYIISNLVAIFMLWSSWKWPVVGRMIYLLLFGWACWTNANTSLAIPEVYVEYSKSAFLPFYRFFILGFFSRHITEIVFTIAICQGLIAFSMLMKGLIFRIGTIGAIVFLVSIAPLGVGAAFPATLIMAAGLWVLFRKRSERYYIWQYWQQKPLKRAVSGKLV